MHATSIPGRVLLNSASDYFGPLNVQIPCIFVTAVAVFSWLAVKSLAAILITIVVYGFAGGGLLALPLSVMAKLTKDHSKLGARMGVFFVSEAIGVVVGTPIAGAIVGKSSEGGNWNGVRIWGGTMIFAGGVVICGSRYVVSKQEGKLWIKV